MRSAWKVRVAGCLPSRVRTAPATVRASCAGGTNRFARPLFDDCAGDTTRKAFLAQRADHVADLVGSGSFEPLRGADAVRRIHAHVERTVLLEAEPALRLVELRGRHAEVEQYPFTGTSFAMRRDQ